MKTTQLRQALLFNPLTKNVFGGVLPCNWLPIKVTRKKNIAYIVNTDPANQEGQHWVAFYFTPQKVYYFDPYGNPPMQKEFHHFMHKRKHGNFYNTRLQGRGKTCGYYCLYFILTMQGHLNLNVFGDDLNFNDRLVRNIIQTHFHL